MLCILDEQRDAEAQRTLDALLKAVGEERGACNVQDSPVAEHKGDRVTRRIDDEWIAPPRAWSQQYGVLDVQLVLRVQDAM